jgi:hypothetical protein
MKTNLMISILFLAVIACNGGGGGSSSGGSKVEISGDFNDQFVQLCSKEIDDTWYDVHSEVDRNHTTSAIVGIGIYNLEGKNIGSPYEIAFDFDSPHRTYDERNAGITKFNKNQICQKISVVIESHRNKGFIISTGYSPTLAHERTNEDEFNNMVSLIISLNPSRMKASATPNHYEDNLSWNSFLRILSKTNLSEFITDVRYIKKPRLDEMLSLLAKHTSLRNLDITHSSNLTKKHTLPFRQLEKLKIVAEHEGETFSQAFDFSLLKHLTHLELEYMDDYYEVSRIKEKDCSENILSNLMKTDSIQVFTLDSSFCVGSIGFDTLRLNKLKKLTLIAAKSSPKIVLTGEMFPKLEEISILSLAHEGEIEISSMKNLTTINFFDFSLDNDYSLRNLTNLEHVTAFETLIFTMIEDLLPLINSSKEIKTKYYGVL